MKKLIFITSFFMLAIAIMSYIMKPTATTYYFSSTGSDANPGTISQPFQTLGKIATLSLSAGDVLSFKGGETFNGSISVPRNDISFTSYGTGKATLTGFASISSWTNLGGNIYESTSAASTLSTCKIISLNGASVAVGRTPNTGYWTIGSTNGNSITDATNLNASSTNWAGAQVVLRKHRWILDKYSISSASGSTINFTNSGDAVEAGWGYFIQNDARACNTLNEWYYNASKKIGIYSGSTPSNLKVPTVETAIDVNTRTGITISNIIITGYNSYGIYAPGNDNLTVSSCEFSFIGDIAVYQYATGQDAAGCLIQNNTFTDIGSMGVYAGYSSNSTITGNTMNRIGRYPGMGGNGDVSYCGIVNVGDNQTISYNNIRAVGYCGIRFDGNSAMIRGNVVDSFCFGKDDGGGIYCYPNATGPNSSISFSTRTVRDNFVFNGIGAIAGGAPSSNFAEVMLYYNDGTSPDVAYRNNTGANGYFGIFSNAGKRMVLDSNRIYNCSRNIHIVNYSNFGIDDWTITNNVSVAKAGQYAIYIEPGADQIPESWVMNNNCYARPINDNQTIWYDPGGSNVYATLAQWKASSFANGQDAASVKSFKSVSNESDVSLVTNYSQSSASVSLPGVWANVKTGATYTNTVPLPAMGSMILLRMSNPPLPTRYIIRGWAADGSEFRWQSLEEENLAYWAVQSSDDGINWVTIGRKKAVGPSLYILRP